MILSVLQHVYVRVRSTVFFLLWNGCRGNSECVSVGAVGLDDVMAGVGVT